MLAKTTKHARKGSKGAHACVHAPAGALADGVETVTVEAGLGGAPSTVRGENGVATHERRLDWMLRLSRAAPPEDRLHEQTGRGTHATRTENFVLFLGLVRARQLLDGEHENAAHVLHVRVHERLVTQLARPAEALQAFQP